MKWIMKVSPKVSSFFQGRFTPILPKELWILDDLTIAVVSKIELTDSTDTFTMTYRTVRTRNFDEIAYEIDIDPDALAKELLDMAKSFYDCPMPFQEL